MLRQENGMVVFSQRLDNMKRFGMCAASLVAVALLTSSVSASIINTGDTVRFFKKAGTVTGGEFAVQKLLGNNTWSKDLFITFCLERNESINLSGDPYYVHDTSNQAINGGLNVANSAGGSNSGVAGPDSIDARTAWLFKQFAKGTLADYDYADAGNSVFDNRDQSANALQRAIWYIENELTDDEWNSLNAKQQYYYNLVTGVSASELRNALGAVRAINPRLPNNPTGLRQSSLQLVPEPASLAVWAGALGLAFFAGRRRRS